MLLHFESQCFKLHNSLVKNNVSFSLVFENNNKYYYCSVELNDKFKYIVLKIFFYKI